VEREDDVDVVGEQLAEEHVAHAVRVVLAPRQRHQVHDVDDAHPQVRQALLEDGRRRDRLHRDHVSGAGEHDVRVAGPVVVPAHSQTPAPRAQCSIASSIVSHCSCGCLSMTTRFTYERERITWSATDSRQFASGGR
jgi:hypothetical protein